MPQLTDQPTLTDPEAGDLIHVVDISAGGKGVSKKATLSSITGLITTTAIKDEGTEVVSAPTAINFIGDGVTASDNSGVADVTVPSTAIKNEGTEIIPAPTAINFIGPGITAVDNAGVADVTVPTISIEEEGTEVVPEPTAINFIGDGVTAVNNAGVADVTISSGKLLQVVSILNSALITALAPIPYDSTTPTDTEGHNYMTLRITPKSSSSLLIINVVGNFSTEFSGNKISMTLTRDDNVSNFVVSATSATPIGADDINTLTINHSETSGTTDEITWRMRAGPNVDGLLQFNSISGGNRIFTGVYNSAIHIYEVEI